MGAYPTSPRAAFLQWCEAHAPVFTANAAAIGLTPAQATAFATATTAGAAALLAQEQARQAALVATQQAQTAFDTLRAGAGDTVRLIRAFAESQTKPEVVYNTAQIPPPSPPSPAPPPAQPTDLTVTLDASGGNLTLRWKAANPTGTSGTSYIIRRRLPGESEFAFIGVSGKKEFVDDSLVAGPDSVQYTVQGQRADSSGPLSPTFTVNFGQAPGGGMMATVMAGAYEATPSTVDGRAVQKVLPNGNGSGKRSKARV
ncbi:MAG: fibronectin type III domain-containing protein [Planctomycetes bacterium]|nr:fibronectin type III domain-containing protein [Planctomycetota bacterium]